MIQLYDAGKAGEASWSIQGETVVEGDSVKGTGTLVFQLNEYTTEDYDTKVDKYPRNLQFYDLLYMEVRKVKLNR